ncbi:MAG: hypothetical protein U1F42_07860 [Candidatus Competibacteraceae bacterium]
MSDNSTKQSSSLNAAVAALRLHLLEKGNRFDRGPAYEGNGKVLSSVKQTVLLYEGMGYTTLMEWGDPPVYAVLERGHREAHIFQPQDPKIQQWLENGEATLDDPAMRAYMLQSSGLNEGDIPVASKPHRFHINEVDDVFILTTEDGD